MMDVAVIAKEVVSFMIPFLPYLVTAGAKAGDKAAEEVGKSLGAGAWDRAKSLWGKLGPKMEAKQSAKEAVNDAIAVPDNEDAHAQLRLQLTKLFTEDETFAKEVAKLWEGTKSSEVAINASGDRSVAAQNIRESTVVTGDGNILK
jgi:hypothetical protein